MDLYALTNADLAALKSGDALCVYLGERHPGGLVRVVKRARQTATTPFSGDVEHLIPAPVRISPGNPLGENFASMGLYGTSVGSEVRDIFCLLRRGDAIAFEFYPDYSGNAYSARADLHVDAVQLLVARKRGGRVMRFTLDVSVCPENSARMCKGQPYPTMLRRDREITHVS